MNKKELCKKYNITLSIANKLIGLGYIKRIHRTKVECDETIFTNGTYENLLEQFRLERNKINSESKKLYWSNMSDEQRTKHLNGMHASRTKDYCNKLSIAKKKNWLNMSDEQRQDISNKIKLAQKKKHDFGYYDSEDWTQIVERKKLKEHNTKKKNGTFNSSKPELEAKNLLEQKFNKVHYQYRCDKYPFNCDFYIEDLDLFIELNFGWQHGLRHYHEPFNKMNKKHVELLNDLLEKAKTSNYYKNVAINWSKRDPLKKQYAIDNKLNWIAFYSIKEFKEWHNSIILKETT